MPCHGPDWTGPTEEEKKYWEEKRKREAIEYMNNTALLLKEVLWMQGEGVGDWTIKTQYLKEFDQEMSDYVTERLCSILGEANEELKEKIRISKYAPYISVWWSEHKKLDKQRENEKK